MSYDITSAIGSSPYSEGQTVHLKANVYQKTYSDIIYNPLTVDKIIVDGGAYKYTLVSKLAVNPSSVSEAYVSQIVTHASAIALAKVSASTWLSTGVAP